MPFLNRGAKTLVEDNRDPKVTPVERDRKYYEYVAGMGKMALFQSMMDLALPAVFRDHGAVSAQFVAGVLGLSPLRARKWLHVLSLMNLVTETTPQGGVEPVYDLSPLSRALFDPAFDPEGKGSYYYREFLRYMQNVLQYDFCSVLKGLPVKDTARWPPPTPALAAEIETWMSVTAHQAIHSFEKAVDLDKVGTMLDAAGGDATMACAFAKAHPNLKLAVFNLANSADLARQRIACESLSDRITVHVVDFRTETPFPSGFELVLWSRVFTDWGSDTVRRCLRKTHKALLPGGRVAICEAMVEGNEDFSLAWEFRYIFWDDFEIAVYKTRQIYEDLLRETGFKPVFYQGIDDASFYSVIIGEKV